MIGQRSNEKLINWNYSSFVWQYHKYLVLHKDHSYTSVHDKHLMMNHWINYHFCDTKTLNLHMFDSWMKMGFVISFRIFVASRKIFRSHMILMPYSSLSCSRGSDLHLSGQSYGEKYKTRNWCWLTTTNWSDSFCYDDVVFSISMSNRFEQEYVGVST